MQAIPSQRFLSYFSVGGLATMCLGIALACGTTWAQAQEFLSIKGSVVNIRTKPTTASDVAWELINGYPLQVMSKQDEWIRVKDFEGPLGWVNKRFVSSQPHFIIQVNSVNLRSEPNTKSSVVAKLNKYDIVETLQKTDTWAKVRNAAGQQGWILQSLAWGW